MRMIRNVAKSIWQAAFPPSLFTPANMGHSICTIASMSSSLFIGWLLGEHAPAFIQFFAKSRDAFSVFSHAEAVELFKRTGQERFRLLPVPQFRFGHADVAKRGRRRLMFAQNLHLDVCGPTVEIRAFPFFAADIPQFPQCVQTGGRLKRDMPINLFPCL